MKNLIIGPLTESGICDQCAVLGDKNKKLVKRFIEEDNIYLCGAHNKEAKEPEGIEEVWVD